MNPQASDMLPPQAVASMIRGGGTPGQLFQDNPLSQNMTPNAMGADPALMQQPPVGSQAMNPTMPQGTQQPMPPVAPDGQTGMQQPQQLSEAGMILNALMERLSHHSKITEKTVGHLGKMLDANQAIANAPTG